MIETTFADPLITDVERVATFSIKFSLPAVLRTHVWKVLLGKFKLLAVMYHSLEVQLNSHY